MKTAKKIPCHTTTKKVLEKDENQNSCEKVETNGNSDRLMENLNEESSQIFEEIKLENQNVDKHLKTQFDLPEIDIKEDKIKRLEDFELHRKLMEEQVGKFIKWFY